MSVHVWAGYVAMHGRRSELRGRFAGLLRVAGSQGVGWRARGELYPPKRPGGVILSSCSSRSGGAKLARSSQTGYAGSGADVYACTRRGGALAGSRRQAGGWRLESRAYDSGPKARTDVG